MKYITLICVAGMSTSMMVARMKDAAKKNGIDAQITAMSESSFGSYDGQTDVLLLGPQISYKYNDIKSRYETENRKVAVIEARKYGMMDGEAVLNDALALIG